MSSEHGGLNFRELIKAGIDPDKVIDFSVSINPAKLPRSIQKIINHSALYRYPDSRNMKLVEDLSAEYNIPAEEIMVVNGTSQAIFLIAAAFLGKEKTALISGPTYSEYRDASEIYGARVIEYSAKESNHFHPDINELKKIIETEKPDVFWICNPNNPTGSWLDEKEINELAAACKKVSSLMVSDEAYRCFAPFGTIPETPHPDVLYLHSMTKDFCIPGLRLGWVKAPSHIIKKLLAFQPEWSVSAPAQDAGSACLNKIDYFEKSWGKTRTLTQQSSKKLEKIGLKVFPTAGNFILVKIGNAEDVKNLSVFLWKNIIQVRDCASFGLNGFIRIGTRSEKEMDMLIKLIADFIRQKGLNKEK